MKSIRAFVDNDWKVGLQFGYDADLVNLVKEVSGFRWDKPSRRWLGSFHALAALEFAGRKRGDVTVIVSWPTVAAPPIVMEGECVWLKEYQRWAAGVLNARREFLLCWAPRVGKTTVVVHAGATAIATRTVDRVFVMTPASVASEWKRQIGWAFPGMTVAEVWGTPVGSEKRQATRARSTDAAVEKAQARALEVAANKFIRAVCRFAKKHGRVAFLSDVAPEVPSAESLTARANAAKEKQEAEYEKALAAERSMVELASTSHWVLTQHDLIAPRRETLSELAALGPFSLVVDEVQSFNDEKAPRSKALVELAHHPNCRKVWLTTGTPMRNRPEDLVVFYDLMGGIGGKTGVGAKWPFLKRYANAHVGVEGFWETQGESNLDELAARLAAVSHRLTREEVRPDLPPISRSVQLCPLSREEGLRYKALEAAVGKQAMKNGGEVNGALKALVSSVLGVKLRVALERVVYHASRGVRVLVAANFHESLRAFDELLRATYPGAPVYCAGGWLPPEKREAVVAEWRSDSRPGVLLVNILSSGVGIDLSDADGTIILEVPWVPSDALQIEARILDIHQGKRTSQPWVEWILAAGTVDEDMALAVLKKIGVIDTVVGAERESTALATALRESGVVQTVDLGLANRSESTVEAALDGLRRRLMGAGEDVSGLSTAAVVGAVEEAFTEDESGEESEDERYERAVAAGA